MRRILTEYVHGTTAVVDGHPCPSSAFSSLLSGWCTDARIQATRDFKLHDAEGTNICGFQGGPSDLWIIGDEQGFAERLVGEGLVRLAILRPMPGWFPDLPINPRPLGRTFLDGLPRLGFVLYALAFLGGYFMSGPPGAVPGLLMAAFALLPLVFGSRVQRLAAVLCLLFAAAFAYVGEQQAAEWREHYERLKQRMRRQSATP